ncbi:MAG: hypothetical protein ACJ8G2_12430 [Burkholderiales bacterium]
MKVLNDLLALAALFWPLTLLLVIGITFLLAIPMAVGYAKRTGRSKWLWAFGTFRVLGLPIFGDWIPTVVMHKYYCAMESGFWTYKTLEQWKAENPGVMETLAANQGAPSKQERFDDGHGTTDFYFLNDRFNWTVSKHDVSRLLPIIRTEQEVKDVKKNEVMARYVDFGIGHSVQESTSSVKFWLHNGHCIDGELNQGLMYSSEHDVREQQNEYDSRIVSAPTNGVRPCPFWLLFQNRDMAPGWRAILILDEATSNLNDETANASGETINQL